MMTCFAINFAENLKTRTQRGHLLCGISKTGCPGDNAAATGAKAAKGNVDRRLVGSNFGDDEGEEEAEGGMETEAVIIS